MSLPNNLVAYSTASAPSGIYERGDVWFDIDNTITSGSYDLIWGNDTYTSAGYTFITNTYTQSLVGATINDSTPIFYVSQTTQSVDVLDTINRLPDRYLETPFNDIDVALEWVQTSGKYITLLSGSIQYPPAIRVLALDAGNVASYPTSGSVWTDTIGGRTFNLINGPGYDPGNGGKIYFYAPGDQYAGCTTSLSDLSTWSVGVWHYYTGGNVGSSPCIVTEVYPGNTATINYALGTLNDDTPLLKAGFFTAGWNETTTPYTLTANNWYYIVGTYDGSAVKLYVNNTLIATTNTTTSAISSQGGINLMKRWDAAQFWDGYLSIVDIYEGAMSPPQISANWNANKGRFGL
jgi:hypothetical protein